VIRVDPARFAEAAILSDQLDGLRAGDALHLAIAMSIGADIWTRDKRLAKAAKTAGTITRLI
jgi:predicted nucleic acid-binding protein